MSDKLADLKEKYESAKSTYDMFKLNPDLGDDFLSMFKAQYEQLKNEYEEELKKQQSKEKPKPKKKIIIKKKKIVENTKETKQEKPQVKKVKTITLEEKRIALRELNETLKALKQTLNDVKKVEGLQDLVKQTEDDIKKVEEQIKEVEEAEVEKRKRGRPKKGVDITKLEPTALLEHIEKQAKIYDERELIRQERLKEILEQRKAERASKNYTRGRPRKYTEQEAKERKKQQTEEAKERLRQYKGKEKRVREIKTSLEIKDIVKLYQKYRNRILDIKESDFGVSEAKDLIQNELLSILQNNTDIDSNDWNNIYKTIKELYPDFTISYTRFLDKAFFALYIYSQLEGLRISKTANTKKAREDVKDTRDELKIFLEQDLTPTQPNYWVNFVYLRLKTNKWDKSIEKLEKDVNT